MSFYGVYESAGAPARSERQLISLYRVCLTLVDSYSCEHATNSITVRRRQDPVVSLRQRFGFAAAAVQKPRSVYRARISTTSRRRTQKSSS